jgi:hypothetical protein
MLRSQSSLNINAWPFKLMIMMMMSLSPKLRALPLYISHYPWVIMLLLLYLNQKVSPELRLSLLVWGQL